MAGLRRHPLPPDGDCFFHLLVHNGLAVTAGEARAQAVARLEEEWDAIAEQTRCPDRMQARISRMRESHEFAELEEVRAAARRYNVRFHIWTPIGDTFVGAHHAAVEVTCASIRAPSPLRRSGVRRRSRATGGHQ